MLLRMLDGILRWLARCAIALFWLFARAARTRAGLATLAIFSLYLAARGCGQAPLRVGTFNIRDFGEQTDFERLTEILAESDMDVIAVQEVKRLESMPQLAERLSARQGRRYQSAVSACGGKRTLHVGFLFDTARVELDKVEEFPELRDDGGGSCTQGARAGLLAVFSKKRWLRKQRYSLLTVHFPAGGGADEARERQRFWERALHIAGRLRKSGETNVLVLGDVNSTGYLDNRHGERDAVHDVVARAGFVVLTQRLRCTEYFEKEPGALQPSHLDHVIGSGDVKVGSAARVWGFCAKLRCEPTPNIPEDYVRVSDHCPVSLDLN